MNEAQLFYDINARLRTDTGVHGLFPSVAAGATPIPAMVTDVLNNWFNPGQGMPFLVIDMISSVPDDTFNGDECEIDYQVSLYNTRTPASLNRSQYIMDRVYGDGIKQSSRLATYGLHRWVPGASTWPARDPQDLWKYTNSIAIPGPTQAHTEDYYHFIRTFRLRMWKDYASTQPA